MRELGKYLGEFWTSHLNPNILLCEPKKYALETSQMIPISRNQINAMSQHGAFEAIGIDIKVSGLDSQSMISLCLRKGDIQRTFSTEVYHDPNNFDDISISGFPRKLMTEDSLASTFLALKLELDIANCYEQRRTPGVLSTCGRLIPRAYCGRNNRTAESREKGIKLDYMMLLVRLTELFSPLIGFLLSHVFIT